MSYLEMKTAPVENMSKAIISLWFRVSAPPKPGELETPGPSGPEENWDMTKFPPPPNSYSGIPWPEGGGIPANGDVYILYNPYGEVIDFLRTQGPNPLIHPLIPVGRPGEFNFDTLQSTPPLPVIPHDKFNILMTFGNPNLPFEHRKWISKKISTMDGVVEFPNTGTVVPFDGRPLPYNHYFTSWPSTVGPPKAGTPLGNNGLLPCVALQLENSATSHTGIIPQSFIAVDDKKKLRIFLQTDNKATYKGYCFVQTAAKTLMMDYSRRYGINQATDWGYFGPFWAGWEFEHKDVSQDWMTQWPEFFVLQGPQVRNGWNHLLLSFDISGTVSATQDATPLTGDPATTQYWRQAFSESCTTGCKAWMTLNNNDQTHFQNPFPMPLYQAAGGTVTGGLPGQAPTTGVGGPIMNAFGRQALNLSENDIVPQNVFATSYRGGIPRYALHHAYAVGAIGLIGVPGGFITAEFYAKQGIVLGDGLPTLYRGGFGGLIPVHNGRGYPAALTTPNPRTLDKPTYNGGPFSIPTAGFPIGLPTGSDLVAHNMGCDQAELQIWIGQAQDTKDIKHLFITDKSEPVAMKKAWDALGKPQIVLHGSASWKQGSNTGTLGVDAKGKKKPGGQFTPTAKIEAFKPDPKVGA